VVNTAGYPDAGGRHTNANMKGIGRFFGHGHPCGGLHLHHYKQQFFLNKKFLSSQAREGCAMVYHNNFGSIFFKSESAKISSNPSINFIRPINSVRTINFVKTLFKILQTHSKKFISFQTIFLIHLFQFSNPFKEFQS
jgi:hypothetical protein